MGLLFDHKTCSRCGGSGKFSWCQAFGDTCFGCSGSGQQLTKKGKVAQAWFTARKKKPAKDVKIGERIVMEGIPGMTRSQVVIVDKVGWSEKPTWKDNETGEEKHHWVVEGVAAKTGERNGIHAFTDTDIRMHVWGDALKALKLEALAFQETLTQDGKIRKRKAKEKTA